MYTYIGCTAVTAIVVGRYFIHVEYTLYVFQATTATAVTECRTVVDCRKSQMNNRLDESLGCHSCRLSHLVVFKRRISSFNVHVYNYYVLCIIIAVTQVGFCFVGLLVGVINSRAVSWFESNAWINNKVSSLKLSTPPPPPWVSLNLNIVSFPSHQKFFVFILPCSSTFVLSAICRPTLPLPCGAMPNHRLKTGRCFKGFVFLDIPPVYRSLPVIQTVADL